jgi:hypothetical protein
LATLSSKGRIRLDISLESFLGEVEARFIVLSISSRACVRALGLPAIYPKDPADRIIGATALVEGLPLLTADRAIRRSRALTPFGEKNRAFSLRPPKNACCCSPGKNLKNPVIEYSNISGFPLNSLKLAGA